MPLEGHSDFLLLVSVAGQIGERWIVGLMKVVKDGEKFAIGSDARNYLNVVWEIE